jgi:hypothetical protein
VLLLDQAGWHLSGSVALPQLCNAHLRASTTPGCTENRNADDISGDQADGLALFGADGTEDVGGRGALIRGCRRTAAASGQWPPSSATSSTTGAPSAVR